jgi:hypothetical protein
MAVYGASKAFVLSFTHENYDYNCLLVLARLGKIFPIHAMLVGQRSAPPACFGGAVSLDGDRLR